MSARDELVDFLVQYGGSCRDCADEDGFCPQTGIGCGQRRKAVEFILGALEYGSKHGFTAGYSIIRDDENHAPTVERAAKIADTAAKNCNWTDGVIEAGNIATAIRSLIQEPNHDE